MTNPVTTVVVILAFICGVATQLTAQNPKRGTPIVEYAQTVVAALGAAQRGAIKPDTAAGGNLMVLATEGFYVSARQRRGMENAISALSPYAGDADSAVRENANELILAFRILREGSLKADSVLRRQLDGVESIATGSAAHRMAEIRAQRHDGAMLMALSIAGLTHALTEEDPVNQGAMLSLTAIQRDALLAAIEREFPAGVRANADGAYASDYVAAISLLDGFLRQEWKTR